MKPIGLPDWQIFISWGNKYLSLLFLVLILLNVILLIVLLVKSRGHRKFRNNYLGLLEGLQTENVEDLVLVHRRQVVEALARVESVENSVALLEEKLALAIQKVGLVRYNAFQGLGSDQSFSVAFLDSQDDGVVFTSIHGREETRFFAKPIQKCKSKYRLSDEELLAVDRAKKDKKMGSLLSREEDTL